jgi:D-alanyl-D-alanine carboxypeptidase
VPRSRRAFPFLRFREGVNWQKVNPLLLAALNRLARSIGKTITVNSGYRSYEEQARLYAEYQRGERAGPVAPPGKSRHQAGEAVDASIDGVSIGKVVDARTLKRFGLATPVPGDPPHVELIGNRARSSQTPTAGNEPGTGTGTDDAATEPEPLEERIGLAAGDPRLDVLPSTTSVSPQGVGPQVEMPGSAWTAVPLAEPNRVETWRMLSALPFRSRDVDRFLALAEAEESPPGL